MQPGQGKGPAGTPRPPGTSRALPLCLGHRVKEQQQHQGGFSAEGDKTVSPGSRHTTPRRPPQAPGVANTVCFTVHTFLRSSTWEIGLGPSCLPHLGLGVLATGDTTSFRQCCVIHSFLHKFSLAGDQGFSESSGRGLGSLGIRIPVQGVGCKHACDVTVG